MSERTQKVSYLRMKDGTKADYMLMAENAVSYQKLTPGRLIAYVDNVLEGIPGEHVDAREHSLQSASRAFRDGAKEEMVVAALLHDIGVPFAPDNHDQFAGEIIRPYVGWNTYWVIRHHGLFQGYFYFHHVGKNRKARDRYIGHPAFQQCVEFCEKWDQASFDPDYDTMPLSAFEPMVHRIFAREPWQERTKQP